jgi:HSP20 family protein
VSKTININKVFAVPKNTDVEQISAHYENGVLNLAFPKLDENIFKKKIQVVTGEKPKLWQNLLGLGKEKKNDTLSVN